MSWCDLDLTFDLAVVTLSFKILSGYILETVRYRNLILGRDIDKGVCRCATSCHTVCCEILLIFVLYLFSYITGCCKLFPWAVG